MCDVGLGVFEGFLGIEAAYQVFELNEDRVCRRQIVMQQRVSLVNLIHTPMMIQKQ